MDAGEALDHAPQGLWLPHDGGGPGPVGAGGPGPAAGGGPAGEAAEKFGIRTAENNYFAALQVYPIQKGGLDSLSGRYTEDAIYNIDERAAAEFDLNFAPKERIEGTPHKNAS